jgi:Virulence protein RhuM family
MNQIEIYQTKDKHIEIEVKFEGDSVWLNQSQLIALFQRDQSVISRHINNVFKEGELDKKSNMHFLHIANSDKPVAHYNLDVIISVGYRVKSQRGTQFRQWATQRLKEYLIQGYTVNEKRLEQLKQTIQLIHQSGSSGELNTNEAKGLLDIIANYTQSFILLNQFDSNNLPDEKLNENITYEIAYKEAVKAISELKKQLIKKKEASALFGNERDGAFDGILNSVIQTFGGEYLYKSIEEQAAHLLYFSLPVGVLTDRNDNHKNIVIDSINVLSKGSFGR